MCKAAMSFIPLSSVKSAMELNCAVQQFLSSLLMFLSCSTTHSEQNRFQLLEVYLEVAREHPEEELGSERMLLLVIERLHDHLPEDIWNEVRDRIIASLEQAPFRHVRNGELRRDPH